MLQPEMRSTVVYPRRRSDCNDSTVRVRWRTAITMTLISPAAVITPNWLTHHRTGGVGCGGNLPRAGERAFLEVA